MRCGDDSYPDCTFGYPEVGPPTIFTAALIVGSWSSPDLKGQSLVYSTGTSEMPTSGN